MLAYVIFYIVLCIRKLKDMKKETLQHLAAAGIIMLLSTIISLLMHNII